MSLRSSGALSAMAAQTRSVPAATAAAARTGQRVRYDISCTWQIPQLIGIFGDESQVVLLAARGRRRDSVQGENERLVIRPQFEWVALEPRAEVFYT